MKKLLPLVLLIAACTGPDEDVAAPQPSVSDAVDLPLPVPVKARTQPAAELPQSEFDPLKVQNIDVMDPDRIKGIRLLRDDFSLRPGERVRPLDPYPPYYMPPYEPEPK
jgi:hypothetical protein